MATSNAALAQMAQAIARLDMIQREQQKQRNVMAQHERRIGDLESDVADLLPPAADEAPSPYDYRIKRVFGGFQVHRGEEPVGEKGSVEHCETLLETLRTGS